MRLYRRPAASLPPRLGDETHDSHLFMGTSISRAQWPDELEVRPIPSEDELGFACSGRAESEVVENSGGRFQARILAHLRLQVGCDGVSRPTDLPGASPVECCSGQPSSLQRPAKRAN